MYAWLLKLTSTPHQEWRVVELCLNISCLNCFFKCCKTSLTNKKKNPYAPRKQLTFLYPPKPQQDGFFQYLCFRLTGYRMKCQRDESERISPCWVFAATDNRICWYADRPSPQTGRSGLGIHLRISNIGGKYFLFKTSIGKLCERDVILLWFFLQTIIRDMAIND